MRGREMAARNIPEYSERRVESGRGLARENVLRADLKAREKLNRQVKLMPRRMQRQCPNEAGDAIGDAGRLRGSLRVSAQNLRRQRKQRRRCRGCVGFKIGDCRHRLVVKIEAARLDQIEQGPRREPVLRDRGEQRSGNRIGAGECETSDGRDLNGSRYGVSNESVRTGHVDRR